MFNRFLIFPLLFGGFSSFSVLAENDIELGLYTSAITYTEPSVMEEKGSLFGFTGRFLSHENGVFLALEGAYSSGEMDYEGSGTIKGIPNEMLEIRGLIGKDFNFRYRVTPYIGLGYRNLNDDSSYMLSSTLASGYEREQIYYYLPIGLEFQESNLGHGWSLRGRLEYDFLIEGINHTYTSTVRGYDDLSFTQHEGYGNRISLGFTRIFGLGRSLTIEPFYKHWNISRSNVSYDSKRRSWVEPYNYSREFGVSLILTI